MQRDSHGRIEAVQEVEHRQLQREIADRHRIVFRLDQIEPDDAGLAGGQLEAREHLRKHLLGRPCAGHLRDDIER